ncbi:cystathionine gamma-synthase 1, chloroplastic-like protein [Tanacetum coccineum]|uniref:Cystathionine gamma-synthase 1, chloroplastic-like protein n=1 Tax=Tanacetum coccineum TaxID=301880 RepID=A0ABQ5C7B4_9ASTR
MSECCLSNHSRHENVKLCVQQQISIAERMTKVFEAHSKVNGDSETTTTKFIDSLKIPYIASSFGDVRQSERAKYGITDNLVRFSFGVEDFEDQAHVPTSFGGDIALVHHRIHTNPNLIHPKRFFSHTSVGERRPDASLEHSIFAEKKKVNGTGCSQEVNGARCSQEADYILNQSN